MSDWVAGDGAQPFFMSGSAGRLFAILYPPKPACATGHYVLCVPPFAEEMNRCRRMTALLARKLSASGTGVLMLDLHGTGDSDGEFGEATREIWGDDLARACQWLLANGAQCISALLVRFGALLATDLVAREEIHRLVLWQPILNGTQMMTQFLRLRLVSSMLDSARENESTTMIRRRLGGGEGMEIAGYRLSPALFSAIEQMNLSDYSSVDCPPIAWFDLVSEAGREVTPASRRAADQLVAHGVALTLMPVAGDQFWATTEITIAPALLDASVAAFDERQYT